MLDTFASVGATRFDVTRTTRAGDKEWFRRSVSLAELARTLPAMLDHATAEPRNVIVRPYGPGVTFIQLDDLNADNLARLAPAVFLPKQPPRRPRPVARWQIRSFHPRCCGSRRHVGKPATKWRAEAVGAFLRRSPPSRCRRQDDRCS
jgi:hypothetical protein